MAVLSASPFVGRDLALSDLEARIVEASHGRGGFVLLTGEAGIGKTRLLHEVCTRADEFAAGVAFTTCWFDGGAPPLWPWARLLDELRRDVGDLDDDLRGDLAARLALAARELQGGHLQEVFQSGDVRGGGPDDLAARHALFDMVVSAVWAAAEVRPRVIVLDDLHAADLASVRLLAAMLPALPRRPVLVLAAARPGEGAAARLLRDAPGIDAIALGPLAEPAVAALVAAAVPGAEREFVEVVVQRTGGHPFFVQELLRLVALRGQASARLVRAAVPATVREALAGRLARLRQPTAHLLEATSVLARPFDAALLGELTGRDEGSVLEAIDEAATAGFLVEDGTAWRFAHDLVRDAVAATLPLHARREAHRTAGEVLARRAGTTSEVARHLLVALPLGDPARAVSAALDAARMSVDRFAYEDAAELLETAASAEDVDVGLRAQVFLALGESRRAAGDTEAATEAFTRVVALVPDDVTRVSAAALGAATRTTDLGVASRAADAPVLDLLEAARRLGGADDSPLQARVLARLAAELYFSADSERALRLAEDAVACARRTGDPGALVTALAVRHDGYVVGHADVATLLRGSEELARLAAGTGDVWSALVARRARVMDLLVAGDLVSVDAEIHAFAHAADERRIAAYRWWPALWRAMRALLEGRHGDAEALAVAAYEMGREPLARLARINLAFQLFFLRREQGRVAELLDGVRRFAQEDADIPAGACALALAAAESGEAGEAASVLERVVGSGLARLRDRNWPASWFQLALAAGEVGDPMIARPLLDAGTELAGQCVQVSLATVCLGAADLGLAVLADVAGDADAADEWFRQAAATNLRLGARSWLAETRSRHAAARARHGDREGAHALATEAMAVATAVGLPTVERRAAGLLRTGARSTPSRQRFVRRGEVWELSFAGESITVRHAKGLEDLAVLLARPGESISVTELLGPEAVPATNGDVLLDPRARREIRARLDELDEELDDATARGDAGTAARAHDEREALLDALRSATGLGGRDRRLGDDAERARKRVAARIRNAITRIDARHPALGRHLGNSIRLGIFCTYQPERPTSWEL